MVGTEAGGTVVSERVSESFTWRRLQSVHLCPSCQSWGSCRILASILRDTPPLAHFLLTDVQWSAHLCYEPITGVKQEILDHVTCFRSPTGYGLAHLYLTPETWNLTSWADVLH
ncbi:uncharacterized protein LOC144913823 isoform X2 [Branchiostoma floridae x Branchiostoma belcheri]